MNHKKNFEHYHEWAINTTEKDSPTCTHLIDAGEENNKIKSRRSRKRTSYKPKS